MSVDAVSVVNPLNFLLCEYEPKTHYVMIHIITYCPESSFSLVSKYFIN